MRAQPLSLSLSLSLSCPPSPSLSPAPTSPAAALPRRRPKSSLAGAYSIFLDPFHLYTPAAGHPDPAIGHALRLRQNPPQLPLLIMSALAYRYVSNLDFMMFPSTHFMYK
jgi:hypothetical protein